MDLTEGTFKEKNDRAKQMMLWFGIISLIMSFAGLSSAVLVSKRREDWMHDFTLPNAFFISCLLIIVSSITFILAKRATKNNNRGLATVMLLLTWIGCSLYIESVFWISTNRRFGLLFYWRIIKCYHEFYLCHCSGSYFTCGCWTYISIGRNL